MQGAVPQINLVSRSALFLSPSHEFCATTHKVQGHKDTLKSFCFLIHPILLLQKTLTRATIFAIVKQYGQVVLWGQTISVVKMIIKYSARNLLQPSFPCTITYPIHSLAQNFRRCWQHQLRGYTNMLRGFSTFFRKALSHSAPNAPSITL